MGTWDQVTQTLMGRSVTWSPWVFPGRSEQKGDTTHVLAGSL